jgi:hypothetical protein
MNGSEQAVSFDPRLARPVGRARSTQGSAAYQVRAQRDSLPGFPAPFVPHDHPFGGLTRQPDLAERICAATRFSVGIHEF